MKYLVTMRSTGYVQDVVEAENPAEALKKAKQARLTLSGRAVAEDLSELVPNPDFNPATDDESERLIEGESWDVISFCEGCSAPILYRAGDPEGAPRYATDENGCYTCATCLVEIEAEEAKQVAEPDEEGCEGGGSEEPCSFPKCKAWGCEPPKKAAK